MKILEILTIVLSLITLVINIATLAILLPGVFGKRS